MPQDHPPRFVGEFVDGLDWAALRFAVQPESFGSPASSPRPLLAALLYGFMTRTRSTRQFERASGENLLLMWLTGLQQPDHGTLSRVYKDNRQAMRPPLKAGVRLAIEVGLVKCAFQAVDGTHLPAAAGRSPQMHQQISQLISAVEAELAAIEASQQREDSHDEPPPSRRARLGREMMRHQLQVTSAEMARD